MIETHPLTAHMVPQDDALWQKQSFTVVRPHALRNLNDFLDSSALAVSKLSALPPGATYQGLQGRSAPSTYMQPGQARGGSIVDRLRARAR
jgi:hypothetical protein